MTERVLNAAQVASRLIEEELRSQAPGRKIGPGLSVEPVIQEGQIEFVVTFADGVKYGVYVNRGTGRYRTSPDYVGRWNPNPGKGTKGIIPRFFTMISDGTQQRVLSLLEEAILVDLEQQIEKEF
jgi:hypothetical protein